MYYLLKMNNKCWLSFKSQVCKHNLSPSLHAAQICILTPVFMLNINQTVHGHDLR